jgi:transcriptional regulator with XRE-family HTH domain
MKVKGLGKVIKDKRRELKLTARELAQKADIDRTYISKIENHDFLPTYHILIKLENALEVNLREYYWKLGLHKPNMILVQAQGNIPQDTKPLPISNKLAKQVIAHFNQYLAKKQKPSLEEVAFDFIKQFMPSKVTDEILINELAGLIAALERFQSRLSQLPPK